MKINSCPLCGSDRINYLDRGEYLCKSCDKFFKKDKEIIYTAEGEIIYVD